MAVYKRTFQFSSSRSKSKDMLSYENEDYVDYIDTKKYIICDIHVPVDSPDSVNVKNKEELQEVSTVSAATDRGKFSYLRFDIFIQTTYYGVFREQMQRKLVSIGYT